METVGPTGVEMEALTAVQVALLTIYDMCKAVDRGMSIHDVRVVEKHGGSRGVISRGSAVTFFRAYEDRLKIGASVGELVIF